MISLRHYIQILRESNKILCFGDYTDGIPKHLKGTMQAVLPYVGDAVAKIGIPQCWEQTIPISHKEQDIINNGDPREYFPLAK